jgi:hypothetical protein
MMAVLSGSIEANVPIKYADKEWSEFVWRSLYGSLAKGLADDLSSITDTDADSGTVKFETEGDKLIKVSVELEYTPHGHGEPDDEVAQAQARLNGDLEKYRKFLLWRCEQDNCRAS